MPCMLIGVQINESSNLKLSDCFYVLLIGEIWWPVIKMTTCLTEDCCAVKKFYVFWFVNITSKPHCILVGYAAIRASHGHYIWRFIIYEIWDLIHFTRPWGFHQSNLFPFYLTMKNGIYFVPCILLYLVFWMYCSMQTYSVSRYYRLSKVNQSCQPK